MYVETNSLCKSYNIYISVTYKIKFGNIFYINILPCKSSSNIFNKKWQCLHVWLVCKFRILLINEVISFKQLGQSSFSNFMDQSSMF